MLKMLFVAIFWAYTIICVSYHFFNLKRDRGLPWPAWFYGLSISMCVKVLQDQFPVKGKCPACRFWLGLMLEATNPCVSLISMFFSLLCLSPPSSLLSTLKSKEKYSWGWKNKIKNKKCQRFEWVKILLRNTSWNEVKWEHFVCRILILNVSDSLVLKMTLAPHFIKIIIWHICV